MKDDLKIPEELRTEIKGAQSKLKAVLQRVINEGGLQLESYVRLLTYQFHLTNGVQRHFFTAASHPDLAHRKSFRQFLVNFAIEEEPHFEIAQRDLANLGFEPLAKPLDVKLWWAYFDSLIIESPFIRLGATCILENIAGAAGAELSHLLSNTNYLTPRSTRFIEIHRHDESLPHGDQILEALVNANLEPRHWDEIIQGAREAQIMYLRLVDWTFSIPRQNQQHDSIPA